MAPDERGKQQYANRFENRGAALTAFLKENKAIEKEGQIIKKEVRIVPFDHSLGYEGNSREANENLLLRTYLDVLTDKKNVGETRLPLDKTTGIIKDEILPIVDGPAKKETIIPYKELSPSYQMAKKYEYNGGKAGIGPFALNNKNHILTQLVKLKFKENALLKQLGFNGLDGTFSRDENVIARDKKGNKIKNEDGTYKYVLDKGVRILDWLSAMINAHVDVAKDPYVIRLNVCQYTYNICNFLLRAGYGKSTFFFLPQPIIKEMAAAYDNASGNYGVDATKSKTKVINDEIQRIRTQYAEKFEKAAERLNKTDIRVEVGKTKGVSFKKVYVVKDENGNDVEKTKPLSWGDDAVRMMDRDFLIDQLQLSHKGMTVEEEYNFYLDQLRISMLFETLNDKAQDMSKLVQLSQIDTKRYGNNFVEQDRFIYRWKAFQVNTDLFEADDVWNYFYDTFLYTKLINGVVTPQALFDGLLFRGTRSFLDSITQALMLTIGLEHNNEQLNKTIANEFEAQIRSQFLIGKVDIKDMFYGPNTMAKRLNKLKSDILNGKYPKYRTQDGKITNGLLNHLDVLSKLYTDHYDAPQIITRKGFGENDKNLNNLLKEYWAELLNDSENAEIQKFAQDLALYMLLTTGGNHTKNGIFNLIPINYVINSGYGDFIKSVTTSFTTSNIDFDAFFLNNWRNDKLVEPIELTEVVYDQFGRATRDKFPIVYFLDEKGTRVPVVLNPTLYSRNQNVYKDPVFQPFVKVNMGTDNNPANTLVYKFVGVNYAKMTPVYVLVNKLGINQNGRVIKEYHTGNTFKSELDFNNHPLANVDIFGDISQYNLLENDKKALERLIEDTVEVRDYMPTTKALRMTLDPAIKRTDKQETPKLPSTENKPAKQLQEIAEDVDVIEPVETTKHTFTFPNGLTVETGFKLNDQQVEALNTLADFVVNPDKYDGEITLAGYAGTGKTTILRFLHQYMKSIGKIVHYAAPTHRAKTVMNISNPDGKAKTLHNLFGLQAHIDITRDKLDLKNLKTNMTEQGARKLDELGGLLIIDESSMLDDTFYEFLHTVGKVFRGIIFVGDEAQLSPVQHEDGRLSKVFIGGGAKIQLTIVERTGDNPILKECTNLRNGLPFTYRTHIVNGEGVTYFNNDDEQQTRDILLKEFAENDPNTNPLHFRVIAGTNDMVAEINDMYREAVYGDKNTPVKKGEILMGYTNIKAMGVEILNNSLDYVVLDAGPERKTTMRSRYGLVEFTGQNILIQSLFDKEAAPVAIQVISKHNSPLVYLELASINRQYYDELNRLWNKGDRKGYATLRKEFDDFVKWTISMVEYKEGKKVILQKAIDFGYAHTIHKSQGGTYNKTMVFESSIDNTQFEDQTKQQLRYVAMSRARQNVWVVTSKQIGKEIKPTAELKMIRTKTDVTRAQAMKTPNILYIFTDNTNRTSGSVTIDPESWYSQKYKKSTPLKYPSVTSARIRGLENARPISTQKWFNPATGQTREKGRWNDSDFELFKNTIDGEIQDIKEAWDSGKYEKIIVAAPNGILRIEGNEGISGMTEKRVPKLYRYLKFKLNELNAYVNGREFNQTYQEKQPVQDINNTSNTDNDPINFAQQKESLETLNSPKTILTNEEALKLRPFVGDMPRIAVASEHTDPVFFSKKIIKILNGEESVQDRYRPNSYTGKDFNALYLITKHDGLPLKELLEQPIPKIIHFSITGLGGTKWEPGVMKPNDLLDRIADFIKQGLDPEMVTVRIDPIVPGVTSTQMIENIVKRASEMGIKKIRYSVMDRYKTTSKYVEAIGYDYSKYYPQGGLHATQEVRDKIDSFMVSMKEKYGVELFTCAEPNSKYADKISKEACLSVAAVNNMLGTSIPETATGSQRQLCSCFGGKTDLLRYDNKCSSSCVYCYAHHNLDKNLNYYNEDGTLKDNPFTRTSKQTDRLIVTGSASTTAAKAKEVGGIDALRHPDANGMHFGNPFSHTNYQGVQKVVPTVKDAVIAFEQWLRGEAHQEVEPERRQWIVNQINNGSLKGKPIVYYTNTVPDNSYGVAEYNAQTAPNHAHILQKLINEGNGSKPVSQPVQLGSFEDKATINIYSRDDNGYRSLSNFTIRPFFMTNKNGTTTSFQSVEQAFQFTKAMFVKNKDVATRIMMTHNSAEIKSLGSAKNLPMTSEQITSWNNLSTGLMYRLMKASFMQNESAKQLLLSTGDAVLTHKNESGQEQDGGRFSKLLMQIRDEIRQMEEEGNEHKNNC